MTDAQFIAWLKSPSSIRKVLVEVAPRIAGVATTLYLSDSGYVTAPSDTPANTTYVPAVTGDIVYTARLSIDGAPSVSWGDIEVMDVGGERQAWLGYKWRNSTVRVYMGDARWARADFRLMLDGLVDHLGSSSNQRLNIIIRDKMARLNTAVTATQLGGSTANKERLLPIALGEVHNIEPLLVDPATLQYQYGTGPSERLIEVRDNGVVAATTNNLTTSKFTLSAAQKGQITCSVQGDKPSAYNNTVATLVQRLATGFGDDPLSGGDLDSTNLAAFDAAHTQPVGLWLPERANVLEACQRLAASVGAQVVMTAEGLLQIIAIELPPSGTPTAVSAINMVNRSLEIQERLPVRAAVQLAYCPNWTVQQTLQTGIPAEHKDLFAKQWLTVLRNDGAVAAAEKLPEAPPDQEETLLLVTADAEAECDRRLALWSAQRTIYAYNAFPELMLEVLGGAQTITHARYGMTGGTSVQVVGLTKGFISGRVRVEVLA